MEKKKVTMNKSMIPEITLSTLIVNILTKENMLLTST